MKKFMEIYILLFGSGVAIAAFIVDPLGVIHSSVLWLTALCIITAASMECVELLKLLDFFKFRKEKEDGTCSD